MSVINKMLRDLDQRQLAGTLDGSTPRTPLPVHASVPFAAPRPSSNAAWRVGLGAVIVVGLSVGGWLAWQQFGVDRAATDVPVAPNPAPNTGSAALESKVLSAPPLATATTIATEPGQANVPASNPAVAEVVDPRPLAQTPEPTAVVAANTAAPQRPVRSGDPANTTPAAVVSLRMESSLSARKALDAVLASPVVQPAIAPAPPTGTSSKANTIHPETISPAQRQQQASVDALQQAQTLWSAGSHAAAIDLLQQSVDAAERAAKTGTSTAGNQSLLGLVRELVRMQMAQSQFGTVWELLVRLEPVLGNQPDLWGIRGNTGQRLGRHQDSVNAYRAALQSRPDEQRWLLGCAVSLAALGQSAQAAEMAERARSVGPISRDVQVYLQQMGVPFKDK